MQISSPGARLELPQSLRTKLFEFRSRVWGIKLLEAVCGALFGVFVAYLATFALDRAFDTPAGLRLALFVAAATGCAMVPVAVHRWMWRHRRLDQLAVLLARKHPSVGDQLLGIIELANSDSEQSRSRALCEAAIQQVSEVAEKRDFSDSVPNPKHRRRAALAALAAVAALALLAIVPKAATNAWARLILPWQDTPRYTFAGVEPLPEELIVAYGEAFQVQVRLSEDTAWRPTEGQVQIEGQTPATATLVGDAYTFELPSQLDAGWLNVRIGDARQQIRVAPTLRPELTSLVADVKLPAYLERTKPLSKDVRGGTISLVSGSRATLTATASRALAAAKVDGAPQAPIGAKVTSPPTEVKESRKVAFEWLDQYGLSSKEPFTVSVSGRPDEPPSLACEDLPRQKVVLDSEVLTFRVKAQDDFGLKRVGIDWQGIDATAVEKPAQGERILSAGGSEKETLDVEGTFSAKAFEIEPQPIHVRIFAEDYLPNRERVYSPTYTLYVLNAEQHAIWLTEMLSKWHRQSMEVRDREVQLLEVNKQLRSLSAEELDDPTTRRRIENQAAAERSNGRRLSNLVMSGEDLVRQAARNPEFGVGHLEKWAEMLQVLKDISSNRMPSVADLLKQSAAAKVAISSTPQGPMAGEVRASTAGGGSGGAPPSKGQKAVPTVADVESSQQPPDKDSKPASGGGKSSPRLGLAQTNLVGGKSKGGECPAGDQLDAAIKEQQDLLAEFEKVADELNRVLANLEGSTLVKRLKAASRGQLKVAERLAEQVDDAFGTLVSTAARSPQTQLYTELADQQTKSSGNVSRIMDDLASYFERRRMIKFRDVLDDMRKQDVVGGLRQIGDDLREENALSISQCEFWSDNLDRWAEDLVDPANSGC